MRNDLRTVGHFYRKELTLEADSGITDAIICRSGGDGTEGRSYVQSMYSELLSQSVISMIMLSLPTPNPSQDTRGAFTCDGDRVPSEAPGMLRPLQKAVRT